MKNIKSHFEMNSRFRNGIFLLVLFISVILSILYYVKSAPMRGMVLKEFIEYQKSIDSLKGIALRSKKSNAAKPFNPNFINEYKGYVLGLSAIELDRLYAFRKQDKWINSKEDFKKVTGISDSLLLEIAPLFKFPDWVQRSKQQKIRNSNKFPKKTYAQKIDLNLVTAQQLENDIGIPDFISERIVRYRNKLNGFLDDSQLLDVVGLYDYQRDKLLSLFTVKSKLVFEPVSINTATVKELMTIPYFDFETALEIKDFVEEQNGILNLEELGKIESFPLDKIGRIALYLSIK